MLFRSAANSRRNFPLAVPSATSQSQGNSGVNNTGTQAVAMGLQARAIEAQVSNTEADTALKIAQATKEAGEASKKPIELKIEQTNEEITDLEKSLKTQNVEIGANEIVRTSAVAQKAMEELNQVAGIHGKQAIQL